MSVSGVILPPFEMPWNSGAVIPTIVKLEPLMVTGLPRIAGSDASARRQNACPTTATGGAEG